MSDDWPSLDEIEGCPTWMSDQNVMLLCDEIGYAVDMYRQHLDSCWVRQAPDLASVFRWLVEENRRLRDEISRLKATSAECLGRCQP
jgi:hypothetical protein